MPVGNGEFMVVFEPLEVAVGVARSCDETVFSRRTVASLNGMRVDALVAYDVSTSADDNTSKSDMVDWLHT